MRSKRGIAKASRVASPNANSGTFVGDVVMVVVEVVVEVEDDAVEDEDEDEDEAVEDEDEVDVDVIGAVTQAVEIVLLCIVTSPVLAKAAP